MRALITGGSRGIGLAIAKKLIAENYEVITPSSQELNLSDQDSISAFNEKNKDIVFDIIINNAGINTLNEIADVSEDQLLSIMMINLMAPILLLKGLVPAMKRNNYGRIVNISSIWGIVSKAKRVQYSATKYGINGVTNTLAVELAPFNILVNSVCPGFTNTELTKKNVSKEEELELCKDIPLGRFAEPSEIAELVEFLVSPRNTYITGQIIAIDGGFTVR